MQINSKRVIEPERYLYALRPGDKFYVALSLAEEDYKKLEVYGIQNDKVPRIPIPYRAATRKNANGYWKPLRHFPRGIFSLCGRLESDK